MEILPIGSLSDSDKILFGTNLYNLSQLKRMNFPIPLGVVISPPEIILQTVLKYVAENNKEVFEQSLTLIKQKITKIPPPVEFESELRDDKKYFFKGEIYANKKALWLNLLTNWLNEIRGKIWNLGFSQGITHHLTPQAVFFLNDQIKQGLAYFDRDKEEIIISFPGRLSPPALNLIDKIVTVGNKKLFIPQIFELLETGNTLKLVGLHPFTESLPPSSKSTIVIPKNPLKKKVKSAMKLFLNLANGFAIDSDIDGLLVEGENSSDFEGLVFRLAEGALSYPEKPVFFKLPDIDDGELKSTMRLLHNKKSLEMACQAFLFVRNKKHLLNVELIVPKVSSLSEFWEIKKALNNYDITRRGSMKLWLEMALPENIINVKNYIDSGLDGVFLDLDYLQKLLIDNSGHSPDLIKIHIQTIINFLSPIFKPLHQAKISIIAKGELILHPDILDFLIEKGCWGIVANTLADTNSLPEQLSWRESRFMQKKTL